MKTKTISELVDELEGMMTMSFHTSSAENRLEKFLDFTDWCKEHGILIEGRPVKEVHNELLERKKNENLSHQREARQR